MAFEGPVLKLSVLKGFLVNLVGNIPGLVRSIALRNRKGLSGELLYRSGKLSYLQPWKLGRTMSKGGIGVSSVILITGEKGWSFGGELDQLDNLSNNM